MDTPQGSVPPQEDNTDVTPSRDSKGAATISGDGSPQQDTTAKDAPKECEECHGRFPVDAERIHGYVRGQRKTFCRSCGERLFKEGVLAVGEPDTANDDERNV